MDFQPVAKLSKFMQYTCADNFKVDELLYYLIVIIYAIFFVQMFLKLRNYCYIICYSHDEQCVIQIYTAVKCLVLM